jgi:hypothetical protein
MVLAAIGAGLGAHSLTRTLPHAGEMSGKALHIQIAFCACVLPHEPRIGVRHYAAGRAFERTE